MPGADLLARLRDAPAETALLLDVDGTLAPIVPKPEDARVPAATRAELRRLAQRYALVAAVSGRPGSVAAEIVGVEGVVYVGEHGLELDPEAAAWAGRLRAFEQEAEWPGEGKPLSASFHYRDHPHPERARLQLESIAERARAAGFRVRWGRKVLEVVPPLDSNKGTAVRRLLGERRLTRALYAGDDTTDLDAFAALDDLELGVRVAISSAESPPELLRAADVVVDGPAAFLQLLEQL